MKLNGSKGFALLIIACGVLILLSKVGFHFGPIMGYIIPFVFIFFGYIGIKNGKSFIGWAMLIIGSLMLLSKLAGLIGLLVAIGLIAIGVSMLKRSPAN